MKLCRGCQKELPLAAFTVSQSVCADRCKKCLDCLSKQARRTGPEAYAKFEAIRNDPDTRNLVSLLSEYGKFYDTWAALGRQGRGAQLALVSYFEESESSTTAKLHGKHVLMWERQAQLFWQSIDGGA